jgi:hypothetical protein
MRLLKPSLLQNILVFCHFSTPAKWPDGKKFQGIYQRLAVCTTINIGYLKVSESARSNKDGQINSGQKGPSRSPILAQVKLGRKRIAG